MNRTVVTALGLTLLLAVPASAFPPAPARTVQAATEVLNDLVAVPENGIPASLLTDAQGIAILPHTVKAGFVLGGRAGHGVILTRERNGAWSGVTFVNLGGASVGFQAGVESSDVVLVFRKRQSLDRILSGKSKLTLGADAAIAAGPIGRQAEAGTDARLQAEIWSYSRSRGLFAGVALDGAALLYDRRANAEYLRDQSPVLAQRTLHLLTRLTEVSAPPPPSSAGVLRAPVLVPRPATEPPLAPPLAPVPAPAQSVAPQRRPPGD